MIQKTELVIRPLREVTDESLVTYANAVLSSYRVYRESCGYAVRVACELGQNNGLTGVPDMDRVISITKNALLSLPELEDIKSDVSALVEMAARAPHKLDDLYVVHRIPKKDGGVRIIEAPTKVLKRVQRAILNNIMYCWFGRFPSAYGFLPGKNIKANARAHCPNRRSPENPGADNRSRWLWKADLQDFFPSISADVVFDALRTRSKRPMAAPEDPAYLAMFNKGEGLFKTNSNALWLGITYLCTYQDRLPQGAPTSPMISNIVYSKLDRVAGVVTKGRGVVYTRYADDICISSDSKEAVMTASGVISKIIRTEIKGGVINPKKTSLGCHGRPIRVTGININHGGTISRYKRDRVRGWLHAVVRRGWVGTKEKRQLIGFRSFYRGVDPVGWDSRCEACFVQMLAMPEKEYSDDCVCGGPSLEGLDMGQIPGAEVRPPDSVANARPEGDGSSGGDSDSGG